MRNLLVPLALTGLLLLMPAAASAQGGVNRAERATERFIDRNGDQLVRGGETQSVDARCQRDRDRDDRRSRERGQRDRDFNCWFRATVEVDRARASQRDDDRRRPDRRDREYRCIGQTSVELDSPGRPEVELRWSRCERIRR